MNDNRGVLFAAWFGGLGPGLLAITLGLLAFDFFFLPPLSLLKNVIWRDSGGR